MRVYLAAPYADRERMETIARRLQSKGIEITARWVFGNEEGLTRPAIADMDLADVDACDTLVSFTFPRGTPSTGGGRHVEFGYALARGKTLVNIGHQENVFHHWWMVQTYPTLNDWLNTLELKS
jgi:nucleoside 2-deoxyribosyltransferase